MSGGLTCFLVSAFLSTNSRGKNLALYLLNAPLSSRVSATLFLSAIHGRSGIVFSRILELLHRKQLPAAAMSSESEPSSAGGKYQHNHTNNRKHSVELRGTVDFGDDCEIYHRDQAISHETRPVN